MDDSKNVGGRDRLVRLLLTAVLSIVAVRSLRRGKRLRGLLSGAGALGIGFTATTGYCGVNDALGVDTTADSETATLADTTASTETDAATTDEDETDSAETDTPTGTARSQLVCDTCGDPIVPGQSRGPNENDNIVHDSCL